MKKLLLAFAFASVVASAWAQTKPVTVLSSQGQLVEYTSAAIPNNSGGFDYEKSQLFVGTRTVKDNEGVCWKEHVTLTGMKDITQNGVTVQTPSTATQAEQIRCGAA